ncbi:MAG: hypothetical protein LUM44_01685 [Pyrinomonadaceae bacterium]|nr:hypothetical protein [Pyrinomonadaceae bacterium]
MSEKEEELTTFEKALKTSDWKPIRNCPGRFQLIGGRSVIPIEKLSESKNPAVEILTEIVPDKVLTIEFEDGGGLISYVKDDGKFIHTLSTKEGFARKINHLTGGIIKK